MYKRKFLYLVICLLQLFSPIRRMVLISLSFLSNLVSFPLYSIVIPVFVLLLVKKNYRRALSFFAFLTVLSAILYLPGIFYTPYKLYENPTEKDLLNLRSYLTEVIRNTDTKQLPLKEICDKAGKIMKTRPPKYALKPNLMNRMHISGIFIPFTGEAILNPCESAFLLPFTAVHELCHRLGFSDEGQTNIHAFLACLYSGDDAFVYSACIYALKYVSLSLDSKNSIPVLLSGDAYRDYMSLQLESADKHGFFDSYPDLVKGLVYLMKNNMLYPITSQGVT